MDKIIEAVARAISREAHNTESEWTDYLAEANAAISIVVGFLWSDGNSNALRIKSEQERKVIEEARKFCDRQVSVNPNNGGLMAAVRKLNGGA